MSYVDVGQFLKSDMDNPCRIPAFYGRLTGLLTAKLRFSVIILYICVKKIYVCLAFSVEFS